MAIKTNECIQEMERRIVSKLRLAGYVVERSAKQRCPVDTGNLRASIHSEVDEGELSAYIGTNVEYAPFVEEGTVKMGARAFLRPAFEENKEQIYKMFEGLL